MGLFRNSMNCIVTAIVFTIITTLAVNITCKDLNQTIENVEDFQENPVTSNKTYNCTGTVCDNFVCTRRTYSGNSPPDWCTNGNRSTNTGCKLSKTCWGDACEVVSSCSREYEYRDKSIFDFKCFGNKCRVKECLNNVCMKAISMKKEIFDNEILHKLPKCYDVDEKESRNKRSSVGGLFALKDYCCQINLQAEGALFGVIRKPRRSEKIETPLTTEKVNVM